MATWLLILLSLVLWISLYEFHIPLYHIIWAMKTIWKIEWIFLTVSYMSGFTLWKFTHGKGPDPLTENTSTWCHFLLWQGKDIFIVCGTKHDTLPLQQIVWDLEIFTFIFLFIMQLFIAILSSGCSNFTVLCTVSQTTLTFVSLRLA